MSDHLFDPKPYGEGRTERRLSPPADTIHSDGRWVLLTSLKGAPSSVAHRLTGGHNQFGGWVTVCGLTGNPITIDAGVEMVPCKKCGR